MAGRRRATLGVALAVLVAAVVPVLGAPNAPGQEGPRMLVPDLAVRTVVAGLSAPTSMAFLGPDDLLVLEKASGRVVRVTNGRQQGSVVDLAVNSASERGLLGIALHPSFPANPGVYLYWSCTSTVAPDADPFLPEEQTCSDANMFGADSSDILRVPLLGNRVDRFVWNGSSLTFDRNLVMLRSFQHDGAPTPQGQGDEAQPARGNHDGGVVTFGPDGKLYIVTGDVGRRGQTQNLPSGPTPTGLGPRVADDQFGGPEPDDAHLSGVILRLNEDGTAPADNPFFGPGAALGGEAGENLQKVFAYGVRNSFGLDFDPISGALWDQQNADDAFDEVNRVQPGMNGGWVQVMGPLERIAQYKQIETTAREGCSSSAGPRRTSPAHPPRRFLACSSCPARSTAIRSSAGRTRLHQRGSAFSRATPWAPTTKAICSWERHGPPSPAATSSASTCQATGTRSRLVTPGWPTEWPTTSTGSMAPRARSC